MGKLLALDLSTTATGFAIYCRDTKELVHSGIIKAERGLGLTRVGYPKVQLVKIQSISKQIVALIESLPDLDAIVIEEVNRGIARLTQKTLDGLHFILIDRMEVHLHKVEFIDSDGRTGWRTQLGLRLSEADKVVNAQRRDINRRIGRTAKKYPMINKKHLACAFANKQYVMTLDCDLRETDGDIADAIGLGHAALHRKK